MRQANVNPASLPRGKGDKLQLNFNELLEKLNAVLIAQYLQKQTLSISKHDLKFIKPKNVRQTKKILH